MMAMRETERDQIDELLPWYAAGTLSKAEAARVEAALAADQELARHFALVRDELAGTIEVNEALDVPSARMSARLFAAIDAEPARASRRAGGGLNLSALFASLTPRTLAWSAAAAVVAIVLQAGVIATMLSHGPAKEGSFRAASAPSSPIAGAYVMIRFATDATAANIAAFLEASKAQIVDGPRPGGLYRIALFGLKKDQLIPMLRSMQANKVVDFVAAEQ